MDIKLNVIHIKRNDTEQNWTEKNPILLNGETGYISSGEHAGMSKTGDGSTVWNDLPFDNAVANGGNSDSVGGHLASEFVFIKDEVASDVYKINADTLEHKDKSYYVNISGVYNANCIFGDNTYVLSLLDSSISITNTVFTLRFIAPNEYQKSATFTLGQDIYIAEDAYFKSGQVVLLNFDKNTLKCYFSSGSGSSGGSISFSGSASDVSIEAISGISSLNVQTALEEIMDGTAKVGNSNLINGKTLEYITDYNNLTNKPNISAGGGVVVSSEQPDVSKTDFLWVDLGNNAILKYSTGTEWIPVGSVWK